MNVRRIVPIKGLQACAFRDALRQHAVSVVVIDELCDCEEVGLLPRNAWCGVIAGCPQDLAYVLTANDFDSAVEILSHSCYRVHEFEKGAYQVRLVTPNGAIAARNQ
jgi:hypothetical protein